MAGITEREHPFSFYFVLFLLSVFHNFFHFPPPMVNADIWSLISLNVSLNISFDIVLRSKSSRIYGENFHSSFQTVSPSPIQRIHFNWCKSGKKCRRMWWGWHWWHPELVRSTDTDRRTITIYDLTICSGFLCRQHKKLVSCLHNNDNWCLEIVSESQTIFATSASDAVVTAKIFNNFKRWGD